MSDPGAPVVAIRPDGTVLGFDVGTRRIGVAVSGGFGLGARALTVVDVHAGEPDWAAIQRLHDEWKPVGLVVGDPMMLEGDGDQPARRRARGFAQALHVRFRIPVVLMDERSSSVEAAQRFARERASGRKRRRDAEALDAVAAAIIVERWLAAPEDAMPL